MTDASAPAPASGPGPADYLRLRQICLVAPELAPAVADVEAVLGLRVCHRDPNVGVFGLENALFAIGTGFLEIVAPTRSGTAAGRFLGRSGGRGGYIAIFDCPDPLARGTRANASGVATAYEVDRPGVYRCVQLHPRDCRAAMIEFDRTEGGEALDGAWWPAGGSGWQALADETSAIRGIVLTSPDPDALAHHWASILGRSAEARTIRLDNDAAVHVQPADDGRERLDAVLLDVADAAAVRRRARGRGLPTGDGGVRLCGVDFRPEERGR